METAYLVVFSVVASVLFLFFFVSHFTLARRLNDLANLENDRWITLNEHTEPKEVQRAVTVAESCAARVDAAAIGLEKFKEQIHREMQRFYGIMRRAEKAESSNFGSPEKEEDVPTEIDPADLKKNPIDDGGRKSKAELRAIAREKGIAI